MKHHFTLRPIWLFVLFFLPQLSQGQWNEKALQNVSFQDLSFFKPTGSNWGIVGKAQGSIDSNKPIVTSSGTGVLVNQFQAGKSAHIFSKEEFGDLDLEVDFMMPKGSNSGIYLMGRYEIQLFDSWQKANPTFADCGGVYQRWNPDLGKGKEGFEGVAPLSNECRAPGLWQNLKISFEAPRFDASGKKIRNARFLEVRLNGVRIHGNIEVSGPTRAAAFQDEQAKGPLMIQGDHGLVAFRQLRLASYGTEEIRWKDLSYKVYTGPHSHISAFKSVKPRIEGKANALDLAHTQTSDEFLIEYEGKLQVPTGGWYHFAFEASGKYRIVVDGEVKLDTSKGGFWWNKREYDQELAAGDHDIQISYFKKNQGTKAYMSFSYFGPGIRLKKLHSEASQAASFSGGQVFLPSENQPYVQRSFFQYKDRKMPYGLHVFTPQNIHFTLNVPTGRILKVWRNKPGEVTGMWVDRGHTQVLYPGGAELSLENPALLSLEAKPYPDTLVGTQSLTWKGYTQKPGDLPLFTYQMGDIEIKERFMPSSRGILAELEFSPAKDQSIWHCLASGQQIEKVSENYFLVDGSYYIYLPNPLEGGVNIQFQSNEMRLMSEVKCVNKRGKISYEWVW